MSGSILTPAMKTAFIRDQKRNKTGFIGVTFRKKRGMYEARIRVPNRKEKLYCGMAKTASDAARLYDAKSLALFGAGAVLNFPITGTAAGPITPGIKG